MIEDSKNVSTHVLCGPLRPARLPYTHALLLSKGSSLAINGHLSPVNRLTVFVPAPLPHHRTGSVLVSGIQKTRKRSHETAKQNSIS